MTLTNLFEEAIQRNASDIHLASGESPRFRVAGELVSIDAPALEREGLASLLQSFMTVDAKVRLDAGMPVERTLVHEDFVFVGILFRSGDDGLAATFRILSNAIPTIDQIGEGADGLLREIADSVRGLVLVTGPTGSGKWTTACAVVDDINARRAARIFVIEGHPNYRFQSKRGLVSQIHIGQDVDSTTRALDIAHQADLDVILLEDLPTLESLRQALIVAETGHLVIANLHAESVTDALQRLFDSAGPEVEALRRALAQTLLAVTSQRLFPRADRPGRVPAYEWLRSTPAVRRAILGGDLAAIRELQSSEPNGRTANQAVDALLQGGLITEDLAEVNRR